MENKKENSPDVNINCEEWEKAKLFKKVGGKYMSNKIIKVQNIKVNITNIV